MTEYLNRQKEWQLSPYAQPFFAAEQAVLEPALKHAIGPSTLQLGDLIEQQVIDKLDLPLVFKTSTELSPQSDLLLDPAFLPFAPDTFSTVVLPHILESHDLPHQVLREAHRVLMSEGHIVLTGFNPISLLGIQRSLRSSAVFAGRYYSPRRVIDWLRLLGFEIVGSAMFQYAPLSRSDNLRKSMQFLEHVGDRWLPMFGGGYMINAKKKDHGMTLAAKPRFVKSKKKRSKLSTAPAKTSLRSTRS